MVAECGSQPSQSGLALVHRLAGSEYIVQRLPKSHACEVMFAAGGMNLQSSTRRTHNFRYFEAKPSENVSIAS